MSQQFENMEIKETINFPSVQINYEEIESCIQYLHDKYDGLIFTEDQTTEARSDMTKLNKIADSLKLTAKKIKDSVVDSISPQLSALSNYESQVREIRSTVEIQLNTHVEKQKNAKRDEIIKMQSILKEEMNANHIEIPFDKKWLANDKKLPYIKDCSVNIINSLLLEEQNRKLAEQARADRFSIIETLVEEFNSKHSIVFSPKVFQSENNITMPIEELKILIENNYIQEVSKQEEIAKRKKEISEKVDAVQKKEEQEELVLTTKTVVLTYNQSHRQVLKDLFTNLEAQGVKYQIL